MKRTLRPLVLILALCLVGLAGGVIGCAAGSVTTSTGAVVPAAVVQTEDNIADALKTWRTTQAQAVALYEATKVTMDPLTRTSRFSLLTNSGHALDTAAALLLAAKRQGAGATLASVIQPLLAIAPEFLALAVSTGLLTQAQANMVTNVLGGIPVSQRLSPPVFFYAENAGGVL